MYFLCYACYSCCPKLRFYEEPAHPLVGCYECNSNFFDGFNDDETPNFSLLFPDFRPLLFKAGCLPPKLQTGKYKPTPESPQNGTNGFDYKRVMIIQEARSRYQGHPPQNTAPRIRIPQIFPHPKPNQKKLFVLADGTLVDKSQGKIKFVIFY